MPVSMRANWGGVISIDTASWGDRGELECAGFEPFVPDREAVAAVPVENLETIAATIDEQEQMTGCRILAEGTRDQAPKCVETFAQICAGGTRNTRTG